MNPEDPPDPLAIQQPCRKFGIDEAIHPAQIAAFQRMTPGQKLEQMAQMYHLGIKLTIIGLRMRHPDWNESQLLHEAQRVSTYGVD